MTYVYKAAEDKDNRFNMSGKVKGVQAQILKVNPLATLSFCSLHTFNLVGVHETGSWPEVAKSFDAIDLLIVWVMIFQYIENQNVILQSGDISLDVESANIKALQKMLVIRCKWDSLLVEASLVAQAVDV